MTSRFTLDEARLPELAERYPVGSDQDALAAIEAALPLTSARPVVSGPCQIAVDLLADADGEVDGLRVLVLLPGGPWLASRIFRVTYGRPGDTAGVIRDVVGMANELLDQLERRET